MNKKNKKKTTLLGTSDKPDIEDESLPYLVHCDLYCRLMLMLEVVPKCHLHTQAVQENPTMKNSGNRV